MSKRVFKKALKEAGITLDGLTICSNEIEVCCYKKNGEFSPLLTARKYGQVAAAISGEYGTCSAYMTGYGGWVIKPGKGIDMGDWNDPSSRYHY